MAAHTFETLAEEFTNVKCLRVDVDEDGVSPGPLEEATGAG